jgi:hypothetical protein
MSVSEQPGRYQRSASGMVGAMLVTLLAILAFVALRACNRTDLEVKPDHVDYLAQVGYAQGSGAADLVYPASLPSGWYATSVDFAPGARPTLGLSMLTAANEYAGLRQSPLPAAQLLTTYVDEHPTADAPVTLDSGIVRHWDTWTDSGGDTALVARWHGETLMVFGSAAQADLETLAGSLTDAALPRPSAGSS